MTNVFTLISDMHVDFPQDKTPYDKLENTVVVAGDTGNGLVGLKFLNKLRRKGFDVWATEGNHEHYSNLTQDRDHGDTTARFREEFPGQGFLFEGVPIILRNGWYVVSDEVLWQNMMNDSKRSCLSRTEVNTLAWNNYNNIKQELESWKNFQYRGVVVTHTAPCEETLDPKFSGQFSNEWYFNPYMRQLLKEYSDQIQLWCHGHTHAYNEAEVYGVRVVCNPRGYPGENPDWEPITLEVT